MLVKEESWICLHASKLFGKRNVSMGKFFKYIKGHNIKIQNYRTGRKL